jgi:hypothetical protein
MHTAQLSVYQSLTPDQPETWDSKCGPSLAHKTLKYQSNKNIASEPQNSIIHNHAHTRNLTRHAISGARPKQIQNSGCGTQGKLRRSSQS